MSHFEDIDATITGISGAISDAFGRLRVSNTDQRLDVEFLYDKQTDYFDEITVGAGTVTHSATTKDLTLAVGSTTFGDSAKMASYPVPYTPGNSQLIDMTGVLDLAAIGTGSVEVFLRSSVSGTIVDLETVAQSSWENASSGVDWSKSHIFSMDFQSLKVGTIRFGLVQNGAFTKVAQINNDNLYNTGYWQLANGSAYWRIYNGAVNTIIEIGYGNEFNAIGFRYTLAKNASATMKAICCTVKSEGGGNLREMEGLRRAIDMGVTSKTVSTTLIPLISIRPKSSFLTAQNLVLSLPQSFTVETDNPIRLVIKHDTVLTGASWVDVDTNQSSVEYDISATAVSNGHDLYIEYIATLKNKSDAKGGLLGKTVLWDRQGAETGIITICAVRSGGTNAAVLAGFGWTELR